MKNIDPGKILVVRLALEIDFDKVKKSHNKQVFEGGSKGV